MKHVFNYVIFLRWYFKKRQVDKSKKIEKFPDDLWILVTQTVKVNSDWKNTLKTMGMFFFKIHPQVVFPNLHKFLSNLQLIPVWKSTWPLNLDCWGLQ